MSSARDDGFTLIETLVSMLVVLLLFSAAGSVSGSVLRERFRSDARSVADRLAQQQMERLLAQPERSPQGCPGSGDALCAGRHGPIAVDAAGRISVGGPYARSWQVDDAVPAPGALRLRVVVTHAWQRNLRSELVTYATTQ